MTVNEIQQSNLTQPNGPEHELIKPAVLPVGDRRLVAKFLSIDSESVPYLREIELMKFVSMGEVMAEVDKEYSKLDNSVFIEIIDEKDIDLDPKDRRPLGVGRFVLNGVTSNKTLEDLTALYNNGTATPPDLHLFKEAAHPLSTEVVSSAFMREHGVLGMDHVMDIATLAPSLTLTMRDKMFVVEALLGALNVFGFTMFYKGGITHITQFTERRMHGYVAKSQYPAVPIFGHGPLVYDTFGNGKGVEGNMLAVPSVIDMHNLASSIQQPGDSRHMRFLGQVLTLNSIGPVKSAA